MNSREKKLAAVLAVAVAAAAIDYAVSYWGGAAQSDSALGTEQVLAQTKNAVAQVGQAYSARALKDEQLQALDQASRPLDGEVLRLLPAAQRSLYGGDHQTRLAYTGFVSIGAVRLAVIEGAEYAVGDKVAQTGEVVRSISNQTVTLYQPQTDSLRQLPYSGDAPDNEQVR